MACRAARLPLGASRQARSRATPRPARYWRGSAWFGQALQNTRGAQLTHDDVAGDSPVMLVNPSVPRSEEQQRGPGGTRRAVVADDGGDVGARVGVEPVLDPHG